ncbi:hypothetical protein KIPB_006432 [Kipferlia bialata]|uniref:Uncharacterized protein n=1 Tax=Kipferlia bialata TaxID=797122 RepID=A0A391NWQ1_9EUKA|nr:hypothetical protein KIPB_006432 [Kipferlia bialata]|eukprot:g6432.t1
MKVGVAEGYLSLSRDVSERHISTVTASVRDPLMPTEDYTKFGDHMSRLVRLASDCGLERYAHTIAEHWTPTSSSCPAAGPAFSVVDSTGTAKTSLLKALCQCQRLSLRASYICMPRSTDANASHAQWPPAPSRRSLISRTIGSLLKVDVTRFPTMVPEVLPYQRLAMATAMMEVVIAASLSLSNACPAKEAGPTLQRWKEWDDAIVGMVCTILKTVAASRSSCREVKEESIGECLVSILSQGTSTEWGNGVRMNWFSNSVAAAVSISDTCVQVIDEGDSMRGVRGVQDPYQDITIWLGVTPDKATNSLVRVVRHAARNLQTANLKVSLTFSGTHIQMLQPLKTTEPPAEVLVNNRPQSGGLLP